MTIPWNDATNVITSFRVLYFSPEHSKQYINCQRSHILLSFIKWIASIWVLAHCASCAAHKEREREWHMRIICANITILMVQCLATVSTPLVTKNVFAISLNAAFPFPQIAVCAVRFHARVSVLEYTPALSLAQSRQSAECSNLLEIKLSILTCTSVLLAFVAHSYTYNTVVVCNYEIRRSSVFEITSNSET